MKENKIIYKNTRYGDCFFEYEETKINKALMFYQQYDEVYIGINTLNNDNRFEIKSTDELYPFFEMLFEKEKMLKIENYFYNFKIFQKDKKIIFRFGFKYQKISFPIEIEDENIKNIVISFLENVRNKNIDNVKTKKLGK